MTKGTIERAFELAPECSDIKSVRAALRREGYSNVDAHLSPARVGPTWARMSGPE